MKKLRHAIPLAGSITHREYHEMAEENEGEGQDITVRESYLVSVSNGNAAVAAVLA